MHVPQPPQRNLLTLSLAAWSLAVWSLAAWSLAALSLAALSLAALSLAALAAAAFFRERFVSFSFFCPPLSLGGGLTFELEHLSLSLSYAETCSMVPFPPQFPLPPLLIEIESFVSGVTI